MSILAAIAIGVVVICWAINSSTNSIVEALIAIKQADEKFQKESLESLDDIKARLLDLSMKN